MRIGIVIRDFSPHRGGAEHWTWQFAAGLIGLGHEVHVVAEQAAPATGRMRLTFHPLPCAKSAWNFAELAEDALRRLPLDVIHDMGHGWHCDLFQPHGGSRRASMEHNLLLLPRPLRAVKRSLVRFLPRYRELEAIAARQYEPQAGDRRPGATPRLFLALSKMVAEHMAEYHHIGPRQLRLVYNGVDVDRFSPERCRPLRDAARRSLKIGASEVALLIVAHNFRLKGVPTLLRALARLQEQGHRPRLIVAGGKQTRGIQSLAGRLGIANQVSFTGSRQDVLPYYAAADLYVHPTFYDPCSLVVLEALACGLPVVTSKFNGAGELITPGVEGDILADPADDQGLARILAPMLDRARLQSMSSAARTLAEQHPFQRNVREIVAIYEELAGRRRAAA